MPGEGPPRLGLIYDLDDDASDDLRRRARAALDEALGPLGLTWEERDLRLAEPLGGAPSLPLIEAAVREILDAVGEDPDREGLQETPARVARMYAEMFAGLHSEAGRHLSKVFTEKYDEIVLVRDISFCSMCEHHLLPFTWTAHIAYLPNGKVVGLSKLARVVEEVARRPQVQERMTNQIAEALESTLEPHGVAVVLEGKHLCMMMRGVQKQESAMVTSAMRGTFSDNPRTRAEFLDLID